MATSFVPLALGASGCAGLGSRSSGGDDAQRPDVEELRVQVAQLTAKVEELQTRVGTMADKVDTTQASFEIFMSRAGKPVAKSGVSKSTQGVTGHPADGLGKTPDPTVSDADPEAGFTNDDSVLEFRKAYVLFQSQKYPESVLAFSSFVERYPDHALAGSAQYYVGASYLKQKEHKLALQEYERLLTSYDRSPKVADALRDMAAIEDALKMPKEAARHRQLLGSVYAQSPAASGSAPELDESAEAKSPGKPAARGAGAGKFDEAPVPATAPISGESH